ncbi:hypothetical protein DXG01_008600 [Tephrocybe rancida]|nr:hypothetical protein DXG01_008600 [Tephrocybe rancida]
MRISVFFLYTAFTAPSLFSSTQAVPIATYITDSLETRGAQPNYPWFSPYNKPSPPPPCPGEPGYTTPVIPGVNVGPYQADRVPGLPYMPHYGDTVKPNPNAVIPGVTVPDVIPGRTVEAPYPASPGQRKPMIYCPVPKRPLPKPSILFEKDPGKKPAASHK